MQGLGGERPVGKKNHWEELCLSVKMTLECKGGNWINLAKDGDN
jgi:hypothetical protein